MIKSDTIEERERERESAATVKVLVNDERLKIYSVVRKI